MSKNNQKDIWMFFVFFILLFHILQCMYV
jgi:hypothetical protein